MKSPKPMTVARLIAELELLPPDAKILLSSDPEGNDINYLYEVETSAYFDYSWGEINLIHADDVGVDDDLPIGVVLGP